MSFYTTQNKQINIYQGDFKTVYKDWETPTVIISDGPYGIGGFPGDPKTADDLGKLYEPFIEIWSESATPNTTLWFWNTELGWANVHPYLEKHGWEFVNCHIWNKGKAHIAGNVNTKTLRKFPVATEVCVQYVKKAIFNVNGKKITMQEWLRSEWQRTGMPLSKTNEVCGVVNAATRKYFTNCHLWYFPPTESFEKISEYANRYGLEDGKPYFSINGKTPLTKEQWEKMRAKFKCPFGITNVWEHPPLNGKERLKNGSKAIHLNQKPLELMNLIIDSTSDENDVIWEPFGGLCSASVSAFQSKRKSFAAEIDHNVYSQAIERFKELENNVRLNPLPIR